MTEIDVPAPTAWPIVLAAGVTFMWAGLLTDVSISVLGVVLACAGSVGWFREVLPHEREIALPVVADDVRIATARKVVERVPIAEDQVRALLPLETYPVSAGVIGGWAGSVAMAVVACGYGLMSAGSIWYPINLLAASIYEQSVTLEPARLYSFHVESFAVAVALHGLGSTLVGLLYGALRPTFSPSAIAHG